MKKNSLFDDIFWKILYCLPLFAYLCLLLSRHGSTVESFADYIATWSPDFMLDVFTQMFENLFSPTGLLPLGAYKIAVPFASYYFTCFTVHLITDVVMFLPKIAMKLLDKSCKL